ncbi:MAG: carbamoyl phosphate synthase large subunit, partial [Tolumonas sp.]
LWYVADAFRSGMSLQDIFNDTKIDPWFLIQIEDLLNLEAQVAATGLAGIDADFMRKLKRKGFADARLAKLLNVKEAGVRALRYQYNVLPVYKRVDTCAAEFATNTAYMYS